VEPSHLSVFVAKTNKEIQALLAIGFVEAGPDSDVLYQYDPARGSAECGSCFHTSHSDHSRPYGHTTESLWRCECDHLSEWNEWQLERLATWISIWNREKTRRPGPVSATSCGLLASFRGLLNLCAWTTSVRMSLAESLPDIVTACERTSPISGTNFFFLQVDVVVVDSRSIFSFSSAWSTDN
jgi:hypothetical protein